MDKFKASGSTESFENVAKKSAEKAQVIVLQNIRNENLIDNPKNGEDVQFTSDLELSMTQNGFTDPIEITDFGMESGKYMILSGHRRRQAGVKVFGSDFLFPCVVRHFDTETELQNYTLMANSQRDSARDPLMFCGRYKMHEEYLESINFKGNKREEIAKRLGISVPQADRYNTMNKVIMPVWDMVRGEVVGMSSVMPMASHSPEEQTEIYDIMQGAQRKGVSLTRDTMKKIVDGYREGKRTWAEVADLPRDSGLPMNAFINTEPGETREPVEYGRNDEVRREFDPIAAEADLMDADRAAWEARQAEESQRDEDLDLDEEDGGPKEKKSPLSEEEKQAKRGKDVKKGLEKLNTAMSDVYVFESDNEAEEVMKNMSSTFCIIVDELYNIAREHGLDKTFKDCLEDMAKKAHEYD